MTDILKFYRDNEKNTLSPFATFSFETRGRLKPVDEPDDIRTPFMRDRDRTIHCKSFRRLISRLRATITEPVLHIRLRFRRLHGLSRVR